MDIIYHIYMKFLLILITSFSSIFALPALSDIPASKVPEVVQIQIQKQYPNATFIEWDFDNEEDIYEVEFRLNGLKHEVKLYPNGTVCLIKANIPLQQLPPSVTSAVIRDIPGYSIRQAKQITIRGYSKYKVDCYSDSAAIRKLKLYYTPDGKLLSKKLDD